MSSRDLPPSGRSEPVLIAEDDTLIRTAVRGWLLDAGWAPVEAATSDEALLRAQERSPAVAICDVDLGRGADGIWVSAELRRRHPGIAIIYATANHRLPPLTTLGPGVTGYLLKPYGCSELLKLVGQASAQCHERRRQTLVVALVERRLELHRRIDELMGRQAEAAKPRPARVPGPSSTLSLDAIVRELLPDQDTGRQDEFVELALRTATRLALPGEHREDLRVALVLRGLGAAVIPPDILTAARGLAPYEREVAAHAPSEAQSAIDLLGWRTAARLVGMLRERWDGQGYPAGLHGEQVPLASRLAGAVDALDAMTSPRAHRPAMSRHQALAELQRCAGTQFDPAVVAALVG